MKTSITIKLLLFFLCTSPLLAHSQTAITVSGTVYSSNNNRAIQGATISCKSTGQIVASNHEGDFVISILAPADTLTVTFVGYATKEVPISSTGLTAIVVYLEELTSQIAEVVVNTGYQSIPKERATGSFTFIDNNLFNRSVSPDLVTRLEGITNAMSYELPRSNINDEPSTTPSLRIRGLNTIEGETQPLFVVDNFPYEGDITSINPNDIESITVLKDAAAASIWGARAGNGVIVVTTKRGTASSKPTINVNSNVTIAKRPDLSYSRSFLPPSETVELERTLYEIGRFNSKDDRTAYTPAVEVLFAFDEGRIDLATANKMLEELKLHDIREGAAEYLYRQSVNQQYAMNINGGATQYQYYLSAGFDNNAGSLIGNEYNRLSLTAKNDFQPTPGLNVSTLINYIETRAAHNGISLRQLSPSGMTDVYAYARLADEVGNALPIVKNNRFPYTDQATDNGLLDWHYRPLDELRINDNTSMSNETRLSTAVSYRFLHGLRAEARYQYQHIVSSSREHHAANSYFARNLVNRFTQADGSQPVPPGGILDRSASTFASHYGRLQLDYNSRWGEQHELNGLAGFEVRQERNIGNGSFRLYGYDDNVLSYATNINFNSSFAVRPISTSRIPNLTSPGNQTVDRFVSYYGNIAYSYGNKYILSSSARWDASNIFGVAFNQKGVPLWSVGAAWNLRNESFFDLVWVDLAKLRLTYGVNGNAVRTLSSLPFVQFGQTNVLSRVPAARFRGVGNPDLSWEKISTINVGLDVTLFAQRVWGSVEWYNKSSSNLIGYDFLDPTTGIFGVGAVFNLDNRRNYADMETKGIDVELTSLNINKQLKWQTTVLFNSVRNQVTNYYERPNTPIANYFNQYGAPVVEGDSRDQMYALPWRGLDGQGSPLVMIDGELGTDYNAYFNNLAPEDLIRVGLSMPPYFGSIRNTVTWQSFSASVNILWKGGHRFRRESIVYNWLFSSATSTHMDYLDRWQNAGDELSTHVPSMPESANLRRDHAYMFSDLLIERGDHIRIQDVSITYQLPVKAISRVGLTQVKLYGYVRDLGIIWKKTKFDIDPDVRALYPKPLQVALGLQVQL